MITFLWIVVFVGLYVFSQYIPYHFTSQWGTWHPFPVERWLYWLCLSSLFAWLSLVILWGRFWWIRERSIIKIEKKTILAFLIIFILGHIFVYNFDMPHPKGDSILDLNLLSCIYEGNAVWKPFENCYGDGRQVFPYMLASPLYAIWGQDDSFPTRSLEMANFCANILFFIFLSLIGIPWILSIAVCVMAYGHFGLVLHQGQFYPQQVAPIFMMMNVIFLRLIHTSRKKRLYTVLFGLSIGMGFNVYDLNYLFGAMMIVCGIFTLIRIHRTKLLALFFLSIIIGWGQMLIYIYKYPIIIFTRLHSKKIGIKSCADLLYFLTWFRNCHWHPKFCHQFMQPISLIPLGIGLIGSFFKRERWFFVLFLLITTGMIVIWIARGNFGPRVASSLAYFYFAYIAIGLTLVYKFLPYKWFQWVMLAIILIYCGHIAYINQKNVSTVSQNINSTVERIFYIRTGKLFYRKLYDYRDYDHLYIITPTPLKDAIYWSGGRTEIYQIMTNVKKKYRFSNRYEDLRANLESKLKELKESHESFAFVFMVEEVCPSLLTVVPKQHHAGVHRAFKNIQRAEAEFNKMISTYNFVGLARESYEVSTLKLKIYESRYRQYSPNPIKPLATGDVMR